MKSTATSDDKGKNPGSTGRFPDPTVAIGNLRPICRLPEKSIESLASHLEKVQVAEGQSLVEKLKDRQYVYYLLDGKLTLTYNSGTSETLSQADDAAQNPLDRRIQGVSDIVSATACVLAKLPWRQLEEYLLQFAPNELDSNTLEVKDVLSSTCSDWMVRLLQSELLSALPPANIQEVMSAVEPLQVRKDETIIRQGDDPDHFYVIEKGQFTVTRHLESSGRDIQLAKLTTGDFFGEEALITGNKRGTTVKAASGGMVLKVHGDTFKRSIVEPTVYKMSSDTARKSLQEGRLIVDVREEEQFAAGAIPNSINLVLKLLRINSNQLDKDASYITASDEPNAAALAAFLLRVRGYDACSLSVPIEAFVTQHQINLVSVEPEKSSHKSVDVESDPASQQADMDAERSAEEISKLDKEHTGKADTPAAKEDYAHTVIGIGLADLLDELHGNDNAAQPDAAANDAGDEPHLREIHSQLPERAFNEQLGETVENLDFSKEQNVVEFDIERRRQQSKVDIESIIEEKVANIRTELEAEMQQELAKHKQAALKALKAHHQKLNKQFQLKQQKLTQNSKKLIALANKISQQKAEVEAARKSLRATPDKSAD